MNAGKPLVILYSIALSTGMLGGCATTEPSVADGQSLKTILAAQVNDAEVANATVNGVRSRSREGSSRPGLMDLLLGGMGRN